MNKDNSPAPSAPEQAGSAADITRRKDVPSTGGMNAGSIPAGRATQDTPMSQEKFEAVMRERERCAEIVLRTGTYVRSDGVSMVDQTAIIAAKEIKDPRPEAEHLPPPPIYRTHCPNGQECGAATTGCAYGVCQLQRDLPEGIVRK